MTQEQIRKLKCTRKQVSDKYWVNVFKNGRKVVAEIWEPSNLWGNKWSVKIKLDRYNGYGARFDSFPEAVEKMGDFLELIHV